MLTTTLIIDSNNNSHIDGVPRVTWLRFLTRILFPELNQTRPSLEGRVLGTGAAGLTAGWMPFLSPSQQH